MTTFVPYEKSITVSPCVLSKDCVVVLVKTDLEEVEIHLKNSWMVARNSYGSLRPWKEEEQHGHLSSERARVEERKAL